MLEINIDKLLAIEASVPNDVESIPKVLLFRGCRIYVFGGDRIYSELDEQTFDALNENQGYGMIDIEFVFENNIVKKAYPKFFTKCFVIRTDSCKIIKPMKLTNEPFYSKINQKGELVVGIRYFFVNEEQVKCIINCNDFLVEGFIAFGKPSNVYGVMCQLHKEEEKWEITVANTYKPGYARNIKYLVD